MKLYTLFGFHLILDIPALFIIVLITGLVYRGIRESRNASNAMVIIKLAVILLHQNRLDDLINEIKNEKNKFSILNQIAIKKLRNQLIKSWRLPLRFCCVLFMHNYVSVGRIALVFNLKV